MESAQMLKRLVSVVEEQEWLESLSDTAESVISQAYDALGDQAVPAKNLLHGSWLGHPAHPMLTDVPVGAWTAAFVLDMADALFKRRDLGAGADAAILLGLIGGTAAAWTGWADWQYTSGKTRRTALFHGLLNLGAAGFYITSLVLRRAGARGAGQVFGTLGFGTMIAGSYLGGELVFDRLVSVNNASEPDEIETYTEIASLDDLEENEPQKFEVDGTPIVVVRQGNLVSALYDVCAHLGVSLAGGEVRDGCIVCPAHGSTYDLSDGRVVAGPSAYPQPAFAVRVREGKVEVRGPS
jgi:nitrite reductase/ring-hydroxylating ferredoxin subunit/uncharacterized membrane protein